MESVPDAVLVAQDKSLSENPLTNSVGGSASGSPAHTSAVESEMKRIHDGVELYIRQSFNTRNFREVRDMMKNGKGIFEDNVRAVYRAKFDKRKIGELNPNCFECYSECYGEELKASSSLTGIGLTCRDICNIKSYLKKGVEGVPDYDDDTCIHEVKTQSIYGVYMLARCRPGGDSFIHVLEQMKEVRVPLERLAILAVETSYLDVPDLRSGPNASSPPSTSWMTIR